ncbi:hypothetical protein KPL47_20345 [Clostridium estertheticum]|uniref:hypothetical protein n=1 Tax=Clostridium estertheticum TaxID=238834 RepID=UPI001C0D7BEE|nr:hypothetical protein [Clostridium estertheticum]MBU3178665.1 hypothetical protein [Clostridium estertheticum]
MVKKLAIKAQKAVMQKSGLQLRKKVKNKWIIKLKLEISNLKNIGVTGVEAAKLLNIIRATLYRHIKEYEM